MTVKKIEKITNISKATIYRAASQKKMKIEVFDKDMKRVIWTEKYGSIEIARQQIQHMKENHFKVESFDIYLDGELTLF